VTNNQNAVEDEEFDIFEQKFTHPSHAEGFTDTVLMPFEPELDNCFQHNIFYSYHH